MNVNPSPAPYRADPKITSLGDKIGDPVRPTDFPDAILRYRNDRWAATVGLDGLSDAEWIEHFARFKPLPDNLPHPLAGKVPQVVSPLNFENEPLSFDRPPPLLGEHTDEILRDIGLAEQA